MMEKLWPSGIGLQGQVSSFRGTGVICGNLCVNSKKGEERVMKTKPFDISERQVAEAYQRVKANKGGAGVDKLSNEQFDQKLHNNLYKLWNRMASGSYFPPPVKAVP